MILSKQQMLSEEQAITATARSTNVIALGSPGTVLGAPAALVRDIGKGNLLPLFIQVDEDFDNLTSLDVAIQTDDDVAFGSAKTVLSMNFLLASLVAGFRSPIVNVPVGVDEDYLSLLYTVNGTNPTAGKITAGIAAAVQTNDTVPGA
ncbi:Bbp16 family capsid cement protein [Methyloceanibacter caenitepidi]|uniref:Phage protein n=1 Tax=Methyloceanibacter caenitepidi TaxID=1384459 RepID=A0A0A8K324_9HYPH|nr:hypothetical protein [Methyloceanibacter caenitepidi]BAQ16917.1 phage protein [Methyloceanibacter caenitepidi]